MIKLEKNRTYKEWNGFNMKEGFWYGTDTETGQYVATSGWEAVGCLAVYYLSGDSWKLEWLPIEDTDFDLNPADLPKIKTGGKLPFKEWLENETGFSYHQWEDLLDGSIQGEEIEEEYQRYLCDDLPKFIRKYL